MQLEEVLFDMAANGYVTHLVTNGAGVIHLLELAYHGQTEEDVEHYISEGQFGLWNETGLLINVAALGSG